MKAAFCTLGCKVNQYDTHAMQDILEAAGWEIVQFADEADVYIVNTCTVTNIADRKSRQMIRRAAEKGGMVGVCGCLAQSDAEAMLLIDGVKFVFGTKARAKIVDYIAAAFESEDKLNFTSDVAKERDFEELKIHESREKTRAHIKISEGCDNFCSYCIIPYVRGRVRSRAAEDIISEANELAKTGVKEVVLTGIHISSYGKDLGDVTLSELISNIADIDGIERIRLGSVEPTLLTDEFCKKAADIKKLCPHFHVSLQSGSDSVLKRMNRHYTAEEYLGYINNLKKYFDRPAITTDIIAGFPGETDTEHAETLALIQRVGFSKIHVFPYSERKGTVAEKLSPKVPSNIKKQRAADIASAGERLAREYMGSLAGMEQSLLLEDELENGMREGYTERYIRCIARGEQGEMISVCLE